MAGILPPSYDEATRQHASVGGDLAFIDFIPNQVERGLFSSRYEPFGVLIDRANAWLMPRPSLEVKTCESIEFKSQGRLPDCQKMTFLEYGQNSTSYIRGLRLWIVPRTDSHRPCQKIGYINLVPNAKDSTSFLGVSTFETLSDLLERFNKSVSTTLPGRIISIESQEMKMPAWSKFDPDRSSWVEHGRTATHFVFVIRVFFEYGMPAGEEVGIADFVPVMLESGGIFTTPRFELFSNVINRASQWCEEQQFLRFCNVQSLEIKMKHGSNIDTQRMSYTEHGGRATYYVRVLRITYTKPPLSFDPTVTSSSPVLHLTCKTFVPYQLTTGVFVPEFESLHKTRERVVSWIQATGARVLSAETVAVRLLIGGQATAGVETSFTYNPANMNEYWIYVIRIYLDGYYNEPPAHMLPPPPQIIDNSCCNIL